jgi:hypothetical protein
VFSVVVLEAHPQHCRLGCAARLACRAPQVRADCARRAQPCPRRRAPTNSPLRTHAFARHPTLCSTSPTTCASPCAATCCVCAPLASCGACLLACASWHRRQKRRLSRRSTALLQQPTSASCSSARHHLEKALGIWECGWCGVVIGVQGVPDRGICGRTNRKKIACASHCLNPQIRCRLRCLSEGRKPLQGWCYGQSFPCDFGHGAWGSIGTETAIETKF